MFKIYPIKGSIEQIDGFYCNGLSAGLKPNAALDLGFIYSDTLCDITSVFTSNKFQAAPLRHYLQKDTNFQTNFVLVNSKNANAMTGKAGVDDVSEILDTLAEKFSLTNPVMSSTGVIGVRIPKEKIIKKALEINLEDKNGENLSQAIMTTDAYPKEILLEVELEDKSSFKIAAVAKGAGMINPNMATMLCFITTDANIPKEDMKELLGLHTKTTFNAISVDGDTSTNDTVMLLTNKKSNAYNKEAFGEALKMVMAKLADDIVSDGEGAKKSVAFEVKGAASDEEAEKCAKALSESLLVKTALFGEDPNWGRIASTIGASGVECKEESLTITFKDVLVYDKGEIYFDSEMEAKAGKILQSDKFKIICDLGIADGTFTAFGCDLGYKYIEINADYRT